MAVPAARRGELARAPQTRRRRRRRRRRRCSVEESLARPLHENLKNVIDHIHLSIRMRKLLRDNHNLFLHRVDCSLPGMEVTSFCLRKLGSIKCEIGYGCVSKGPVLEIKVPGMETAEEPEFLESSLLLFCNVLLGLILVVGITANLLVLLVFYRKPGLRTTANRFVINLMIINIVACLSLLPITLGNGNFTAGNGYHCFAEKFSSVFCSSVIVYAVLLIAVDQYFAVVDPLHYHRIISSWKGYLMIASTWGFSAVLGLLGALQPRVSAFRKDESSNGSDRSPTAAEKLLKESSYDIYSLAFSVSYVVAAFAVPFGLIAFIYSRICVAASGNSRRTRTSVLSTDDCTQALREKFHPETNEPTVKSFSKQNHALSDRRNASGLLQESSSNPSFVVTRPSPPRPLAKPETKADTKCECEVKELNQIRTSPENGAKGRIDGEVPFLKPTLKNNQSFTKLSSLHIQFSNSIEKLNDIQTSERRHSNIPLPVLDPEFENLSKTRSSSVQSNFYEIPSRSSSSTRSTATSIYMQSSRSSSLNSTSARFPPSRASSIRSTSSYIVHNIRHRISNASLFRYREEARAARISALVIVMALFCWLPFFAMFSLRHGLFLENFPGYFDGFSVVLLLLSTIVSPFLFAFRNRQIKKEMQKMFRVCPERLRRDCSKSFYRHNFSLNLKSQTVHLFDETNKKTVAREEVSQFDTKT